MGEPLHGSRRNPLQRVHLRRPTAGVTSAHLESGEPVICQPPPTRVRVRRFCCKPLRITTIARFPWTLAAATVGTESKNLGSDIGFLRSGAPYSVSRFL